MLTEKLVSHDVYTKEVRKTENTLAASVIVPTRNEAGNVEMLLTYLKNAFGNTPIEVVFVDDSTDETPQVVEMAVKHFPNLNVRLIHREPEQRVGGLGGAVVAGLNAARAEYACVMDGDLQHPPELVPVLLKTAIEKQADIVVATRRNEESQVTGLNTTRNLISKGLDLVGRMFFPRQLRGVSDPLTGFFLVRVNALDLEALRPKGFKILLEILVRNPGLRKAEIPFHFGQRFAGQSKASVMEAWKYFTLLWSLRFGEESLRFSGFALIGASGIFVNSLVLYLGTDIFHLYYLLSAAVATVASTVWNFGLTEGLVYRSKNQSHGLFKRFGLFFVMNTIALALRTPMIYLLTTVLGIYYVISNLASLVVLTFLRFALADNLIWEQKSSSATSVRKPNLIA